MSKIYLQTIAYNAEKTIQRCINSIVNQTYSGEIVWHILDNGSTDRTLQILLEYAKQYPFICISHIEKNCTPQNAEERRLWNQVCKRTYSDLEENDFYCMIDADDEYKVDFFKEALAFMQKNELDIVVAGNDFIDATTNKVTGVRKLEHSLILDNAIEYGKLFPIYHVFMRTVWGKLFRGATLKNYARKDNLAYGNDTHFVFHTLRNASKVGILNRSLYKYYVNPKSVSYEYTSRRFLSDIYLYNDASDFLTSFGPVNAHNRDFLQAVYSNAVTDTLGVIRNSGLSPAEKLREYRRITEHPITLAAYRECTDESAKRSRTILLERALEAGAALEKEAGDDLRAVMQTLSPRCGRAVFSGNAGLFLKNAGLRNALLQDDPEPVLDILLDLLEKNQGVKKYALSEAIQALAADKPLLCQINVGAFLRKYGNLYRMVWREEYLPALEEMTGLLLEQKVDTARETFLTLFISLSALEEQAPAFLFGKLRLAELYLRKNQLGACRTIVSELEEMGLTNSEELDGLRSALEERGA